MFMSVNFFLDLQEKSYKKEANKLGQFDRLCRVVAFSEDDFVKT